MRVWTGVCRRWVILVFLSFMGWFCVGMDACGVEGGRLLPPRGGNAVVEFSAEEGINVSGELSAFRGKRGEGGEIPVRPLSDSQALEIGRRIWQNECAGTIEGLTAWNEGEGFASLGIGHFIWYPEGKDGPFRESFPEFVGFLLRNGGYVPEWVVKARGCPWPDRKAFLASFHQRRMIELREWLVATIPQQARFLANRLVLAFPVMLEAAPAASRDKIRRNFQRVAKEPLGMYALIDYVNFKGEGTSPTERYNGQGWGLLQVLEEMHEGPALREFSSAAIRVLERRVRNSPPQRGESRWLEGWRKRCRTYSPD